MVSGEMSRVGEIEAGGGGGEGVGAGVKELVEANRQLKAELDEAIMEATKLKDQLKVVEAGSKNGVASGKNAAKAQSRYWTRDEHERFLSAVELYGSRDVRSIADYVGTRNPTQVRTHAQKYFMKVAKADSGARKDSKKGMTKSASGIELLLSVASNHSSIAPRC
uniref:HTH myb-type domain-containing protein n=1 Tax=Rhodosorus marinus TaxID=101924 RepID=A0A7S2ZC08_9RHOD|mmetsp:Transcript_12737/g.51272  ORF Transcript_12737/g.51272 Transcript_12737/m.51272 type:complete len:165 (+) Transcript_12737:120-614(+)